MIKKFLAFLFIASVANSAGPMYEKTDVLSGNTITLTNKTIDCSLNTCTNIPASGFGNIVGHSVLGNAGSSTGPVSALNRPTVNGVTLAPVNYAFGVGANLGFFNLLGGTLSGAASNAPNLLVSPLNFYFSSDAVDTTTNGVNNLNVLAIDDVLATGWTGGRTAVLCDLNITATPATPEGAVGIVGCLGLVKANSNLGGTSGAYANQLGGLFGGNDNVQAIGTQIATGSITGAGSGLTTGTYTVVPGVGGTGGGSYFTVVVSGGIATSISVTNSGSGYSVNDAITFSTANIGGTGSTPTWTVATINGNGATNLNLVNGRETDVSIGTGASAAELKGTNIVHLSQHAVRGTITDTAIEIGDQIGASATWLQGLTFGSAPHQWPFGNDSTLIGVTQQIYGLLGVPISTQPTPALNGVDFRLVTFQSGGCAFCSTGFFVDPSGNIKTRTTALLDTSAAFNVTLAATSSTTLTAGRALTLDVVNGARTLKLGSNLTIASDPGTVTGALKSNGSGTFAQAACADLSNGATGCSTTVGSMATQSAGGVAITGGTIAGLTGLAIRDTSAAFDVTLAATSSTALTAGRTLTLDMKNVAHTLALGSTANTITFPSASSYTVIGSGDSGTVTNTMLAGSITLANLATQATNTVVGNATSGSATPTALAVGTCSTSASALNWTTNTGFGCNTSINAATLGGATFSAPGAIGGGTAAAGNFTTLGTSGLLSPALGITVTGGDANILASDNHNTNVNTGTSTGTFTAGQNSSSPSSIVLAGPVSFQAGTAKSGASWGTTSPVFNGVAMTLNDTTASGTVTSDYAYTLQAPNFTSTGGASTTITTAGNLWLAAPTCTTVICTNKYSLVSAGQILVQNNIVGTLGTVINGGAIALNKNSNNTLELGDGSDTQLVTIGGGSNAVTINATTLTLGGSTLLTSSSPSTFSNATFKLTGITTGTNADTVCKAADGTILIQAAACTISSLRFKEDVKDITDSTIPEIAHMQVASFRMKDGGSNVDPNAATTQTGLIAENIAQVAPECAIYENDMKTPKSYRQECVIALLVKGEQELVEQNAMLKARVEQLEAR